MVQSSVSQTVLLADPFCLRKITTDPHIIAHVNTECLDDRYQELKICMLELMSRSCQYTPVAYVTVHCMVWS